MTHQTLAPPDLDIELLRKRAEQLLADARTDPILDGLIGWYAAEAERLAIGALGVTVALVDAVLGEAPDEVVYGHPTVVMAAAGICRAAARVRG